MTRTAQHPAPDPSMLARWSAHQDLLTPSGRAPSATVRVPLNVFGIAFGLGGLATAWHVAAEWGFVPLGVSTGLFVLAAAAWAACLVAYLRWALASSGRLVGDLQDRTAGPFAALIVIVPILMAANGLAPYALPAARVIVDVFVVLVVALGGLLTGLWMRGGTDIDRLHPGYFLPTVAGGLVASAGAGTVGQRRLAEVLLGLGLVCWLILSSMILARLILRPPLPGALAPTMAIELAPAAVASLAYFSINGSRTDIVAAALAGYGLLMVLAQLPLMSRYRRLPFMLSTWSFTFSWAAVAATVVAWLGITRPAGSILWTYLGLAGLTVLIGTISVRTVVALARRTLLTAPPAARPGAPTEPTA